MHEHVTRRTVIRSVSAALALAAAGSTAACGQSDTAAGQERLLIGVAQADTTVSFLATLDKAIEEEAEKLGMDTVILNGEYDNAVQAANVNQLVARKVDVILVISSSPTAVVPAIRNAADAGIPVIAVNARLDEAAEVVTYVGASDFDYGKGEGQLLAQALPQGGDVAVILGPLGSTPQVQRLAGLKEAIQDRPDIRIVATPNDDFDSSKNLAVTQDLLTSTRGASWPRSWRRDPRCTSAPTTPSRTAAARSSSSPVTTPSRSRSPSAPARCTARSTRARNWRASWGSGTPTPG